MKRLLLTSFLLLVPMFAQADVPYRRGSICQTSECGYAERAVWKRAVANANGAMAKRVAKMIRDWEAAGYPEGFLPVRYEKIHNRYRTDIKVAADRWLFGVMGHDKETMNLLVDNMVVIGEEEIFHSVIGVILFQGEVR